MQRQPQRLRIETYDHPVATALVQEIGPETIAQQLDHAVLRADSDRSAASSQSRRCSAVALRIGARS